MKSGQSDTNLKVSVGSKLRPKLEITFRLDYVSAYTSLLQPTADVWKASSLQF